MDLMKKEDIIILPNPHLRQKSSRVHVVTPETIQLVKDMTDTAIDWESSRPHEISAAIAAVQVDKLECVTVIRSDFDDKDVQKFTALIDPQIVKYEGKIVEDYEGCLSVPDIYGLVPRYSRIRIKALDVDGNEVRFKADGFLARIIQHEVDHTNGIVFIDRIKDKKKAFFKLDEKGDLQPLDYDKDIKNNHILWD
jgi:peptide deformylase